jgi:hypothetical protein
MNTRASYGSRVPIRATRMRTSSHRRGPQPSALTGRGHFSQNNEG